MRLPRFHIRALMIAVAASAVLLALEVRRQSWAIQTQCPGTLKRIGIRLVPQSVPPPVPPSSPISPSRNRRLG